MAKRTASTTDPINMDIEPIMAADGLLDSLDNDTGNDSDVDLNASAAFWFNDDDDDSVPPEQANADASQPVINDAQPTINTNSTEPAQKSDKPLPTTPKAAWRFKGMVTRASNALKVATDKPTEKNIAHAARLAEMAMVKITSDYQGDDKDTLISSVSTILDTVSNLVPTEPHPAESKPEPTKQVVTLADNAVPDAPASQSDNAPVIPDTASEEAPAEPPSQPEQSSASDLDRKYAEIERERVEHMPEANTLPDAIKAHIRENATSQEQAEQAIAMATGIINDPDAPMADALALSRYSRYSEPVINRLLDITGNGHYSSYAGNQGSREHISKGLKTIKDPNASLNGKIAVPSILKAEKDNAIWNQVIISDFGYPFVNFSADAFRDMSAKDETTAAKAKRTFIKSLKSMSDATKGAFSWIWGRLTGEPAAILNFMKSERGSEAHPRYLVVDANDMLYATEDDAVAATPISTEGDSAERHGNVTLQMPFIMQFYTLVSPDESPKAYLKYGNYSNMGEFIESLKMNNGVPEFYVLQPKRARFRTIPLPGTLMSGIKRIFGASEKADAIKVSIDGHQGALIMPHSHTSSLFNED